MARRGTLGAPPLGGSRLILVQPVEPSQPTARVGRRDQGHYGVASDKGAVSDDGLIGGRHG